MGVEVVPTWDPEHYLESIWKQEAAVSLPGDCSNFETLLMVCFKRKDNCLGFNWERDCTRCHDPPCADTSIPVPSGNITCLPSLHSPAYNFTAVTDRVLCEKGSYLLI